MNRQIRICDQCKYEAREDLQPEEYKNFNTVNISFSGMYDSHSWKIEKHYFHICGTCLEKLGIARHIKQKAQAPESDTQTILYETIAEIVRSELADAGVR